LIHRPPADTLRLVRLGCYPGEHERRCPLNSVDHSKAISSIHEPSSTKADATG